jgi:hypothetical protein
VLDFADLEKLQRSLVEKDSGFFAQSLAFVKMLCSACKQTWSWKEISGPGNLNYALKNYFCISVAAIAGNFFCGNVFTEMSSTMPATLSLLLSRSAGSSFQANLTRLLGVTLGKVLPIFVMAFVSLVGVVGTKVTVVHLIMIFAYMGLFTYLYYTSPEWSTMGCLIAGFGCYALVGTSMTTTWSQASFAAAYKEIGQITVAIGFQLLVDVFDCIATGTFPRDQVATLTRIIGTGTWTPKKAPGIIMDGYHTFFEGDFDLCCQRVREAKRHLGSVRNLLTQCHSKAQILAGKRTMFPYFMYDQISNYLDELLAEMDVLVLVVKSIDDPLLGNFDFSEVITRRDKERFLRMFTRVFARLQLILEHTDEDPIEVPDLVRPRERREDRGVEESKKDAGVSMRSAVTLRALDRAINAVLQIERICIASGRFADGK